MANNKRKVSNKIKQKMQKRKIYYYVYLVLSSILLFVISYILNLHPIVLFILSFVNVVWISDSCAMAIDAIIDSRNYRLRRAAKAFDRRRKTRYFELRTERIKFLLAEALKQYFDRDGDSTIEISDAGNITITTKNP